MPLTEEEIALLSNRKFFEAKIQATEKIKALMQEIRLEYLSLVKPSELCCPPETDFNLGQIAKGENYEGCPYVILDFPKYFSKTDIFTFRTMFWYGHGLIFSLVLAGERLSHYRKRFAANYGTLAEQKLLIGKGGVWDWREEACLNLTATNRNEVLKILDELPFMKLMQLYPPSVLADTGRVLECAKAFYQTTLTIISR